MGKGQNGILSEKRHFEEKAAFTLNGVQ